ncbi:putative transcriptional regulator, Crp/Fnr family [Emticicia oligotrophica DSM 17448]|uniref:Transcriptional regulator, Crp/Fnr family n=1 Tax=Emticicia oligotrophica (strain DSM 17448 / CIP 109782 / MTCC 6937 / GPTSA100-15) TaxID=929562 RepID=A0ABM5N220_EMTOG|nr:Crp/Fnr family transcriptional regulator [Emticicia oligotrophica]AFK03410.1 putative transcriptional regulator, Crp/Fnr family [Emticicia oligotrophica DSM 17448]
MHPLIDHFQGYLLLDKEEIEIISQRVSFCKIKRRQIILQEGQVCKHYTFVVKGCFRMYGIDDKGYEHNIQFAAENDWIADIDSFHSGKPSKLYIQAIEPAEVIQLDSPNLYFLYENIPKLNRIFKVIAENKFIELQNRVLQTFSSTAETRYLSFLEQYRHLTNRLPNTQIASYLGITPEFLSKIRKDLCKNH